MATLSDKINFAAEEEKILQLWNELNAFQRSLELSEGKPEVSIFYSFL
jgi:isoleucyl-tRNA synthetase